MRFELFQAAGGKGDGVDLKVAQVAELDEIETAHGRQGLVLAADRLFQDVAFHVDGLVGQIQRAASPPLESVCRLQ